MKKKQHANKKILTNKIEPSQACRNKKSVELDFHWQKNPVRSKSIVLLYRAVWLDAIGRPHGSPWYATSRCHSTST